MISIPKNDYATPTEVREDVVQLICDAFLCNNAFSFFVPSGMHKTNYVCSKAFVSDPSIFKEKSPVKFRGCEMEAAFAEIVKAGYHIFRVSHAGGSYKVTKKPFYPYGGKEVFEFTEKID
jgi:hypothetical protein